MGNMLFNNMAPEFPKMKGIIDVCTMPEHHVPETEYHLGKPSAPTPQPAHTTNTRGGK